ncbi:hypothetical protein V2J09_013350 [Rumex salicifolius]
MYSSYNLDACGDDDDGKMEHELVSKKRKNPLQGVENVQLLKKGKEALLKSFNGQEEKYKKTLDIIGKRLLRTQKDQDEVQDELPKYINGEGLFGRPIAIRERKTKSPASYKKKKLVITIKID